VNSAHKAVIDKAQSDLERNILQEYGAADRGAGRDFPSPHRRGMAAFPYLASPSPITEMFPFLAMRAFSVHHDVHDDHADCCISRATGMLHDNPSVLVSNIIFSIVTVLMGSDFLPGGG
jgi:hypothetical protein